MRFPLSSSIQRFFIYSERNTISLCIRFRKNNRLRRRGNRRTGFRFFRGRGGIRRIPSTGVCACVIGFRGAAPLRCASGACVCLCTIVRGIALAVSRRPAAGRAVGPAAAGTQGHGKNTRHSSTNPFCFQNASLQLYCEIYKNILIIYNDYKGNLTYCQKELNGLVDEK